MISRGDWIVEALANEQAVASHLPVAGDQVEIRIDGQWGRSLTGTVVSLDSSGTRHITHPALTHVNGGTIPVSPESSQADQPYFPIRVTINETDSFIQHGMKTEVTLARHAMPLGTHFYRRLLLFMNRLHSAKSAG
jgi:hypothetical protein